MSSEAQSPVTSTTTLPLLTPSTTNATDTRSTPSAAARAAASSTSTSTSTSSGFTFPPYTNFPPFYTLQPNLSTRARQISYWSALILAYCAHHRIFRLSLSTPPADLFSNAGISRALSPADTRALLTALSTPAHGARIEWIPIPASSFSGASSQQQQQQCWVLWRTVAEWADELYGWIEATGHKGAVLTLYELREGEAVRSKAWREMDEDLLRKVLAVLVKRGKAQVFGQEENAGVKFF